jgi:hypothetical protein
MRSIWAKYSDSIYCSSGKPVASVIFPGLKWEICKYYRARNFVDISARW